jgi:hypothetical protein
MSSLANVPTWAWVLGGVVFLGAIGAVIWAANQPGGVAGVVGAATGKTPVPPKTSPNPWYGASLPPHRPSHRRRRRRRKDGTFDDGKPSYYVTMPDGTKVKRKTRRTRRRAR